MRLWGPVEPGSSRWAVLAALVCACGSSTPPAEEADDTSEGIAVDESSRGDETPDDPTASGKLDVGGGADSEGGDEGSAGEGCQRVDVVLAVDNSSSMGEEIEALQGPVLDALPQALLSVNGGIEDFQLAVIDACPKPAYFHDQGAAGACDFSTGRNYMSSTSPDLVAEFACVSNFAVDGFGAAPDECLDEGDFKDDDEQAAWTSAQAIGPAALMGANEGFLRDDALLFVVAITDEDESLVDVDSADMIYESIVAAKGGDVSRVVFLGVAGASDCDGAYGSAELADTMGSVVASFGLQNRGYFWDICQGELEQAFLSAIEQLVDPACEEFEPVG